MSPLRFCIFFLIMVKIKKNSVNPYFRIWGIVLSLGNSPIPREQFYRSEIVLFSVIRSMCTKEQYTAAQLSGIALSLGNSTISRKLRYLSGIVLNLGNSAIYSTISKIREITLFSNVVLDQYRFNLKKQKILRLKISLELCPFLLFIYTSSLNLIYSTNTTVSVELPNN